VKKNVLWVTCQNERPLNAMDKLVYFICIILGSRELTFDKLRQLVFGVGREKSGPDQVVNPLPC
jgi:hypothetical protein